jgi:hypothetical protein
MVVGDVIWCGVGTKSKQGNNSSIWSILITTNKWFSRDTQNAIFLTFFLSLFL